MSKKLKKLLRENRDWPKLIFWLVLAVSAAWGINYLNRPKITVWGDLSGYRMNEAEVETHSFIQKNSLGAMYFPSIDIYEEPDRVIRFAMGLGLIEKGDTTYEIIRCESNFDPEVCNFQYGCRAGMGLFGIIPGTWNSTLDKMMAEGAYLPERCQEKFYLPAGLERTEPIFDPECNVFVGLWLLRNEGVRHWGTSETDWGSYDCWSK